MGKGKRFVALLSIAALAGGALYAGKILNGIGGGPGGIGIKNVIESMTNPRGKFPGKDRVNVLLVGKDYNYTSKGILTTKEYRIDPTTGKKVERNISRADTILLLSCDLENGKVTTLSIPRDTKVTAPDGKTGKINATYAHGGAKLLRETIGDLTGVTPDYVVAIKPSAVREIVDLLGGVDVQTIDEMHYVDNQAKLKVDLPNGPQRLDGSRAEGFIRYRKADIFQRKADGITPIYIGDDREGHPLFRRKPKSEIKSSLEEGDDRRMNRQQQLIRALIAEGKKPRNWLRADKIINESLGMIQTDLKREQLFALAAIYRGVQTDQIASATLVGEGTTRGMYFFIPDPVKTRAMVDWLIKGDEAAANRVTKVAVENGTGIVGAARRAAEMLHDKAGFDAEAHSTPAKKGPDGKPAETTRTQIVYTKAVFRSRAEAVAKLLGGGTLVKETAPDMAGVQRTALQQPDVTVRLGRDLANQFGQRSASR